MTEFSDLFRESVRIAAAYQEQADLAVCLEDEELAMAVLAVLTRHPDGASLYVISEETKQPHQLVSRFLEAAERLGNVRKRNAIRWKIAWPEGFRYRKEQP